MSEAKEEQKKGRKRSRERSDDDDSSESGSDSSWVSDSDDSSSRSRSRSPAKKKKKHEHKSKEKKHKHSRKHSHKRKRKHKHKHSKRHHRSSSSSSSSSSESSPSPPPPPRARPEASEEDGSYSNSSNPFNDANLSTQFVWKAKLKKMKAEGKDVRQYLRDRNGATRSQERRLEIERAKQRRLAREREHEQWAQERERMEREANRAEFGDYELQENSFLALQAAKRAQIRVAEHRARPLDRLVIALSASDPADAPPVGEEDEPVALIERCSDPAALAQMREDAAAYVELAREGRVGNAERDSEEARRAIAERLLTFFGAFVVVCDDAARQASQTAAAPSAATGATGATGDVRDVAEAVARWQQESGDEAQGVSRLVMADVVDMFEAKTSAELAALREQIAAKTRGGNVTDVEYWQHLLARLDVYRARAVLRETHREVVARQLDRLEATAAAAAAAAASTSTHLAMPAAQATRSREEAYKEVLGVFGAERGPGERADVAGDDEDDDDFANYDDSGIPGMGIDRGEAFNEPVPLPPRAQDQREQQEARASWALLGDKYRPRKPKCFNRVFAGYDWSRYNRTHYDHDNPPPKTVKGYKFNIFYPDLLDKTAAPTFYLEADPEGNKDYCLLRFHAGPPYEDIAFRIPNRPWERVPKFGYRCFFDKGILHLWFHFRRLRYRK